RRGADEAVTNGLVTVNGQVATTGTRVRRGDVVKYQTPRGEEVLQHWQGTAQAKTQAPAAVHEQRKFLYIKYWKPAGVTCTSDKSDPTNIITKGRFDLLPQRLFTVGRLDKDSTGLILLTSDGRVNNAMLNKSCRKEKDYTVQLDRAPSDEQIEKLKAGVVITTPVQRDRHGRVGRGSVTKDVTARTLPCYIKRKSPTVLEFTLVEGRNRQIRRMAEAVGLNVLALHRTAFA
ncbi:pseudouridine synthase, partial [Ochromonadaceae sp. CCMP2298]